MLSALGMTHSSLAAFLGFLWNWSPCFNASWNKLPLELFLEWIRDVAELWHLHPVQVQMPSAEIKKKRNQYPKSFNFGWLEQGYQRWHFAPVNEFLRLLLLSNRLLWKVPLPLGSRQWWTSWSATWIIRKEKLLKLIALSKVLPLKQQVLVLPCQQNNVDCTKENVWRNKRLALRIY